MTNGLRRKQVQTASAVFAAGEHDAGAIRAIEDISTVIRLKRGDRLDLGPDRPKLVYVVRSGFLILQAELSNNRNVAVALYSPGTIVRASELPAMRSIAAIATAPCQVLRAGDGAFDRLMEQSEEVRAYCSRGLAQQIARDKAHIVLLSGFSGEERVASFFVEMAHRLGRRHGAMISAEIPFSRSDIANFLALNPDTLSRICSRLKALGLMRSSGRRSVEILDLAALAKLAPGELGLMTPDRSEIPLQAAPM